MNKIDKKSKLYFVTNIFLTILSSVIIGMVIISLFGGLLNSSYAWLIYAIAIFIYVLIAYNSAHSVGDNDANCNAENTTFKSEICALIATLPSTVLAVLCLLLELGVMTSSRNPAIVTVIYRFLHISFRLIFDYFEAYPILYFVPSALTFVLSVIGYRFGLKRIKISDYLYYAREKEE